jgi:hypothetical protein
VYMELEHPLFFESLCNPVQSRMQGDYFS